MIDILKPYTNYKCSALPWVGKVPEHWDENRAKCFFHEVDERSTTGAEQLLSVSHVTGVTPRKQNVTMFMAETNIGHKITRPGDLVINTMWAWMAALGVAKQTGVVSPAYGVYRPRPSNGLLPDFADRLLRTQAYAAEYLCRSTGIRPSRLRLYPEQFLRVPILCPPHDEQAAIIRFLEYTDRRIRRYIRAKKNLIALLNEQKQAIIHRAVTRGLNPIVKFKSSEIAWLGETPEHWVVSPFKARVAFREGPGIMRTDFRESGIPLLRISCLLSKGDPLDGCNYLHPDMVAKKWSHFAVLPGDYLLSASTSASTITVCCSSEPMIGAIPYTGLIRLWPRDPDVNMEYVALLIQSRLLQDQLLLARSGVGIAHFGPTHLKRLWIALPPKAEQDQLVTALRVSCLSIYRLEELYSRQITLLQEYRTCVIADIVTGKLDDRDAAAQLPYEAEDPEAIDDWDEVVEDGEAVNDPDIEEAAIGAEA